MYNLYNVLEVAGLDRNIVPYISVGVSVTQVASSVISVSFCSQSQLQLFYTRGQNHFILDKYKLKALDYCTIEEDMLW